MLIGLLLPGANAVLFLAERDIPIGVASLIIASVPLLVVLLRLARASGCGRSASRAWASASSGSRCCCEPSGEATALSVGLCVTSAVMWSVGSFAAARLTMPARPVHGDDVRDARGRPRDAADRDRDRRLRAVDAVHGSLLAWLYLVSFGSVVGYTAYSWLLHHAPLATVVDLRVREPGRRDHPRRGLPRRERDAQILVGAAIVVASVAVVVRQEPPVATQPEEGVR